MISDNFDHDENVYQLKIEDWKQCVKIKIESSDGGDNTISKK